MAAASNRTWAPGARFTAIRPRRNTGAAFAAPRERPPDRPFTGCTSAAYIRRPLPAAGPHAQIPRMAEPTSPPAPRGLVPLFAGAILLNALLLFLVQPLFGKMMLPLLGGAPAVWNTCMLFFQAALLGGYVYAHLGARLLGPGRLAVLHVALLAVALLGLPFAVDGAPPASQEGAPTWWLLERLVLTLGVPFTLLAAGSPLLQHLFARTGHPSGRDPYFLYAASNVGSLAALLAYPVLLEPALPVAAQARSWAVGYAALVLVVAGCAVALRRARRAGAPADEALLAEAEHDATSEPPQDGRAQAAPPSWRPPAAGSRAPSDAVSPRAQRARWLVLALVPSSLLLGITSYVTTDIAAVPLLWVLPLALYLLSFVAAFSERRWFGHARAVRLMPVSLLALAALLFWGSSPRGISLVIAPLLAFFVIALVLHGELYASRPAAERLTEFYLLVALGGMLGGAVNVLLAPVLFETELELPIMLAASAFLVPALRPRIGRGDALLLLGFMTACAFIVLEDVANAERPERWLTAAITALFALALVRFRSHPVLFGSAAATIFVAAELRALHRDVVFEDRSFYGVHRVREVSSEGGVVLRFFQHGRTLHGAQQPDLEFRRTPLTYYHPEGPLGSVFFIARQARPTLSVGALGLGVGSVAAYAEPGDRWRFFEIDPTVERMARDTALFTYLADAPVPMPVTIGDGRLTLAAAPDASFDVLVVDAFTSDAVPVHLLTREAVALYLRKLRPGGLVAVNVSNRYLDLGAVLGAVADSLDVVVRQKWDRSPHQPGTVQGVRRTSSHWAVIARDSADVEALTRRVGWVAVDRRAGLRAWTDDYSSLLGVLRIGL